MRVCCPRAVVLSVVGVVFPTGLQGQTPSKPRVEVATVAPRPEDVSSVDGIIKAFYEVISGPAGQPRQWARDRTLYITGVRFVSTGAQGSESRPYARVMDHQSFVDQSDGFMVREGFYEQEIHRVSRTFGNIVHVFSTYEMRAKPDGPLLGRGVNSIQLFNDGTRWWIASVTWDDERPGNPIPLDLLPNPIAAASGKPIDRLAWLAGCWEQRGSDRWVEEQWLQPLGGMMIGMGRTVAGGKTLSYEHMRIEEREGRLVFTAMPSGQPQAAFASSQIIDSAVVFANPAHDFPQRVSYRHMPDGSLLARIEGETDGKVRGVDFPLLRAQCRP